MTSRGNKIHIVVPALNEEANLQMLLPDLVKIYNVVVVDNSSTDSTAQVARACGAEVLFCKRRGYGSAVNTGFKYLLARLKADATEPSKNCVVVFDADGTSPIEAIAKLAEPVLNNEADLVIGQRTSLEHGSMPVHARFGNALQTQLIGWFTGKKYLDMGPLRALSLGAVQTLKMTDPTWGWNVEMQIKAALIPLRIQEMHIHYKKRIYGQSKISGSILGSLRASVRILVAVFWYVAVAKIQLIAHGSRSQPSAPIFKILLSRFLTRSGDQAWDFALPVALVYILPENLSLVALIFLCTKLGSVVLQPWVASVIDRWNRFSCALLGTGLQVAGLLGVTLAVSLIAVQVASGLFQLDAWATRALLCGIVLGSVLSSLGAALMDIAVGNDWVPSVVPNQQLARVNSRLRQIDLATEVGAPVVAGALLAMGAINGVPFGFLLVAFWNIASFVPEVFLLRHVFLNSAQLQRSSVADNSLRRDGLLKSIVQGWHDFRLQPIYAPMVSYAALWLSALSPHGVLLTAFLKGSWTLSEFSLGVFRGLGAVFGLLATLLFPWLRQRLGLVHASLLFLVSQAGLLVASVPFFAARTGQGWVFLGLILFSRIGLYGFSLGEMELRQRTIAEGYRGKVNGVASSLASLATLVLFGLGALLPGHDDFIVLVAFSVSAVCCGALIFVQWSRGPIAQTLNESSGMKYLS